jgi:hypothetical protein
MDFASRPITCFIAKRPVQAKKYPDADGSMYINTTTPDEKKVDESGMIVNKNSAGIDYSEFIGVYNVGSTDEADNYDWSEELLKMVKYIETIPLFPTFTL